jgi:topoisomerase IA-like protein
MTDEPRQLTDAEKMAALEAYLKVLKPAADALRAKVTADMGAMHVERVGAYLPDGTKLAAVSHSDGRRSARVTDEAAALEWCLKQHPDEVQTVQVIRPAYLKMLLDLAKADNAPAGGLGMDPQTGEVLPFIEVAQGSPYVIVTTTDEGTERMAALANGFTAMLEEKS